MKKPKAESLIGFAVKAGKILYGLDNIKAAHTGIHLIIYSTDASEKTQKEIKYQAKEKGLPLVESQKSIEEIVYKGGIKAVAIKDRQMSRAILNSLDNETFREIKQ